MNEYVEECRREWRFLGVPDPVANEMAADLMADLDEARSEGATAEDVLGNSAFDPRSFAASWAVARGVTAPALATVPTDVVAMNDVARLGAVTDATSATGPVDGAAPLASAGFSRPGGTLRRRPIAAVAVAALTALVALVALAAVAGRQSAAFAVSPVRRILTGPGPAHLIPPGLLAPGGAVVLHHGPGAAVALLVLVVALVALGVAAWYLTPWSGRRQRVLARLDDRRP
ncbi:MAG: hypothetical protein ABSG81_01660 [Acidimicrobiales bacterium]